MDILRILHWRGIKHKIAMHLVNHRYAGTKQKYFEKKRRLLNSIGYRIGEGTKIVAPIECSGKLTIGKNCWIGKNLKVNGNGSVTIGDNCDLGPEVTFQTGGHEIGGPERRAGNGLIFNQSVGNGTWIGGRATILNNAKIGNSCVVAGCACVTKDIEDNCIVGGVPAKMIRKMCDDDS